MPDTKLRPTRFGHVNATNCNSYLNIICIKLVTQVEKTKIRTPALDAPQLKSMSAPVRATENRYIRKNREACCSLSCSTSWGWLPASVPYGFTAFSAQIVMHRKTRWKYCSDTQNRNKVVFVIDWDNSIAQLICSNAVPTKDSLTITKIY